MRRVALLLILCSLALLPTASAWANSGPPPAQLWFTFEDEAGRPVKTGFSKSSHDLEDALRKAYDHI